MCGCLVVAWPLSSPTRLRKATGLQPKRMWGRLGATHQAVPSGPPLEYMSMESLWHLTHSSNLSSPRKWERGGEAGVRATPCAQL
jgi:hypothetical protein